jgi:leucyl aminopeptidase
MANFLHSIQIIPGTKIPTVPLWVRAVIGSDEASLSMPGPKPGDVQVIGSLDGIQQLSVSLGKKGKQTTDAYRQAGASLARWLQKNNVFLSGLILDAEMPQLSAFFEGIYLGAYQFNQFRSEQKETEKIIVHFQTSQKNQKSVEELVDQVAVVTSMVNLVRDISHQPANVINPVSLSDMLAELSKENGIKFGFIGAAELAEMGAGGITSVGKGSQTPPRLIILEYTPKNAAGKTPIALVGKAITFDTGGYSIKNTSNILRMKYDKCGGITVAGILLAAAKLQLPVPLIGIIPAAENMISGNAYRPDDILTMLSGKSVEIASTDAEGRLILADALTYTQKHYHPRAIIDFATLTGGVVVALGRIRAGLLSNSDELVKDLMTAGDQTGERLWQLPLDDEYLEGIKGEDADLKNSGGHEASTISGGMFLKQFIESDIPWAHIDIAGMAESPKELPYSPKGATGFGVRLILEYLKQLK